MASSKLDARLVSSASTSTPESKARNIAFLGATGGCTLAALTHTLLHDPTNTSSTPDARALDQHHQFRCIALARNPSKLQNLLLAQEGITPELLSRKLTIVQGDATDKEAVKRVLRVTASTSSGVSTGAEREGNHHHHHHDYAEVELVDTIISGLGGTPKLQWWSIRQPVTLDNPTICQDAARTLVAALRELLLYDIPAAADDDEKKKKKNMMMKRRKKTNNKPLLAFISTTGISHGPQDVPFWFRWLYRYMLAVPHEDKRAMESIFCSQASGSSAVNGELDGEDREKVLRGVVGVRPSLLTGTGDVREGLGMARVRVGSKQEPAVGYSIRRADVGEWVFSEVVARKAAGVCEEAWSQTMVTLTC